VASAHVYLLRCRDGSLYCGWTVDPHERVATHNAGKGAAYTRSRRPVQLVYLETLPDKSAALRREYAIKRLTRLEKLQLVASSPPAPRSPRAKSARARTTASSANLPKVNGLSRRKPEPRRRRRAASG
jgi:putative endonuclease